MKKKIHKRKDKYILPRVFFIRTYLDLFTSTYLGVLLCKYYFKMQIYIYHRKFSVDCIDSLQNAATDI